MINSHQNIVVASTSQANSLAPTRYTNFIRKHWWNHCLEFLPTKDASMVYSLTHPREDINKDMQNHILTSACTMIRIIYKLDWDIFSNFFQIKTRSFSTLKFFAGEIIKWNLKTYAPSPIAVEIYVFTHLYAHGCIRFKEKGKQRTSKGQTRILGLSTNKKPSTHSMVYSRN